MPKILHTLEEAIQATEKLAAILTCSNYLQVCGSVRRKCPEVGDIDIVVSEPWDDFHEHVISGMNFTGGPQKYQSTFEGIPVDLYIVPRANLGAAYLHYTGSPMFNIGCRKLVKQFDDSWSLSQYGISSAHGDSISGLEEVDIFRAMEVNFIQPEERSVYDWSNFWRLIRRHQ